MSLWCCPGGNPCPASPGGGCSCSGACQPRVPPARSVAKELCPSSRRLDSPRSDILATSSPAAAPTPASSTLRGFKSRCTTPRRCSSAMPSAIPRATCISTAEGAPRAHTTPACPRSTACSRLQSQRSSTRYTREASEAEVKKRSTLRCVTARSMRFSPIASSASSRRMHFTATFIPSQEPATQYVPPQPWPRTWCGKTLRSPSSSMSVSPSEAATAEEGASGGACPDSAAAAAAVDGWAGATGTSRHLPRRRRQAQSDLAQPANDMNPECRAALLAGSLRIMDVLCAPANRSQ